MLIAFLGLGKMGSAIAGLLLDKGHTVTVWNRTAGRAADLVSKGARQAATPADAVAGCEAVMTMLMDDAAVEDTILGEDGTLSSLNAGAVHVCLSTISVALSERLAEEHTRRHQGYVAAPVFGRPNVAAEGKLWTVAAGHPDAVKRIRPILDSFSRGVTVLGDQPQQAHALKLGGNFMITAMIATMSEAFVYAEKQGIAPAAFLEAVNSALFQSPFYAAYGKVMLNPPPQIGATVALGAKDTRLFREAASAVNSPVPMADAFQQQLHCASESGMKDHDWAAGYYQSVKNKAGKNKAGII